MYLFISAHALKAKARILQYLSKSELYFKINVFENIKGEIKLNEDVIDVYYVLGE